MPVCQTESHYEYGSQKFLVTTQNSWSIVGSALTSEEENIKEFDASISRNDELKVASLNDGLPENLVVGKTSTESSEECVENV